jgi:presqualene diphosphate synthase
VSVDVAAVEESKRTAANRAAGSSFYTAMRILPRPQREAMFEIYSFCRQVDDIADSDRPRPQRLADLERWREDIARIYAGTPAAHLQAAAKAVYRFGLRQSDFLAVIDGMEMDAAADIRAPDWVTLDRYCDCVASAVGRLSVRVFGLEEQDGIALAHHLGRALQLTNILRDIDEDAALGRLYLPREALQGAGIAASDPATVLVHPALGRACVPVVERARSHFEQAMTIMARSPRRAVRAPRIMGEVYRAKLAALVARGWSNPRRPIHMPRGRLLWIILRHAFV